MEGLEGLIPQHSRVDSISDFIQEIDIYALEAEDGKLKPEDFAKFIEENNVYLDTSKYVFKPDTAEKFKLLYSNPGVQNLKEKYPGLNKVNEFASKLKPALDLGGKDSPILKLVMSYLSAKDLGRAGTVSRVWNEAQNNELVDWVNTHSDTPLREIGFESYEKLELFVRDNGGLLTSLNLEGLDFPDEDVNKLIDYCPNLESINFGFHGSDSNLEHLQGKPLKKVVSYSSLHITDQGFAYLKDLPLQHLVVGSSPVTDEGLKNLKNMLLESVVIHTAPNITDEGLRNLKDMPLREVNFCFCRRLTLDGMLYLNKQSLEQINVTMCPKIDAEQLLKAFPGAEILG